ncbi:MAG: DNA polymerase III subunit gamma/tau, partial [candidate division WOR-3 bacterium]
MPSRQVLTLKYRPQTFDELLIQDHVTRTLKRAIELNRLANAYLFAGPRGVGKTTAARILAKSLNCLSFDRPTTTPCNRCSACIEIAESRSMDVLEIDGASERKIDDIRELRENIRYTPIGLRFKVYIIDEVHMLTAEAFNALLKTLEEPPSHAKFIFATTESHRVPLTIVSRCQRFDFRKALPAEIIDRLAWIAQKENIKVSQEALAAIARHADGAIRDAESILDQLWSYCPEGIEVKHVEEVLGLVPAGLFHEFVDLLIANDAKGLVRFIDRLFEAGYDLSEFYAGLVEHFRDLLLFQVSGTAPGAGLLPDEEERLRKQARAFSRERLLSILDTLARNEERAKRTSIPRVLLELLSLELAGLAETKGVEKTSVDCSSAAPG